MKKDKERECGQGGQEKGQKEGAKRGREKRENMVNTAGL